MKATKQEIIDSVALDSQLHKSQIKSVLNLILDHMQQLLIQHGRIEMRGFGTFLTRTRRARNNVRNPRTGALVSVPDRTVVVFRPGRKFRQTISCTNIASRNG